MNNSSLITGYIVYTLKTPDGKDILRGVKHFDSFVRNFMVMIESVLLGQHSRFTLPPYSNATDVTGSSVQLGRPSPPSGSSGGSSGDPYFGWSIVADAGDRLEFFGLPTDWGILVGSGDSPTTINFWKLESPYPHGRTVGRMNYMSSNITEPVFDGSYVRFDIKRIIINESDATQIVREVGLVGLEYRTRNKFLFARDVITPPISMPPKSMLEITIVLAGLLAPLNIFFRRDAGVGTDSSIRSII